MNTKNALRIILSLLLVILVCYGCLLLFPNYYWRIVFAKERNELIQNARIGWTRKRVQAQLGRPVWVVRSLDEVQDVSSWDPPPTKPVEGVMLVFNKTFTRIYVYVNRKGIVYYTQIART